MAFLIEETSEASSAMVRAEHLFSNIECSVDALKSESENPCNQKSTTYHPCSGPKSLSGRDIKRRKFIDSSHDHRACSGVEFEGGSFHKKMKAKDDLDQGGCQDEISTAVSQFHDRLVHIPLINSRHDKNPKNGTTVLGKTFVETNNLFCPSQDLGIHRDRYSEQSTPLEDFSISASQQVSFKPSNCSLPDKDTNLLPETIPHLFSESDPSTSVKILKHELLDDDYVYFPLDLPPQDISNVSIDSYDASAIRLNYIQGQQVVLPGYTRYRVDVQYQGSDFDGWYKSTTAQKCHSRASSVTSSYVSVSQFQHKRMDEKKMTKRDPHSSNNQYCEDLYEDAQNGGARVCLHAKTVLEEALSVALDVPEVRVTSSVIPETGISVRRLSCHFDASSDLDLQPRTIIQRATMWLQKRRQPLAILCCHQCKNQDFHSRHSCMRRVYCYRILNRIAPPLFDAGLQWHIDRHLDVARMQRFAKAMEGTKDYGYFVDPKMANALRRSAAHIGLPSTSTGKCRDHEITTFHRNACEDIVRNKVTFDHGLSNLDRAASLPTFNKYGQRVVDYRARSKEYFKSHTNLPTIRTIDRIEVVRQDDEVLIWFIGKSFLRHQIRNMVSVLKASGHGLWNELDLQNVFTSGFNASREKFKRERLPPAPAYALMLWDVEFPREYHDDNVPFTDSGLYQRAKSFLVS